jgi:hypothetical protein
MQSGINPGSGVELKLRRYPTAIPAPVAYAQSFERPPKLRCRDPRVTVKVEPQPLLQEQKQMCAENKCLWKSAFCPRLDAATGYLLWQMDFMVTSLKLSVG